MYEFQRVGGQVRSPILFEDLMGALCLSSKVGHAILSQ